MQIENRNLKYKHNIIEYQNNTPKIPKNTKNNMFRIET